MDAVDFKVILLSHVMHCEALAAYKNINRDKEGLQNARFTSI